MHPALDIIKPTESETKLKKNLLISCIVTLILKHYSLDPIKLASTSIESVNDALFAYIYTKGAFFACDLFAVATLFLFLSYIRLGIVKFLTQAEDLSMEILTDVLQSNKLPTNKKEAFEIIGKVRQITSNLKRYIKEYVKKEIETQCESNHLTPSTYYCMIPMLIIWASKEFFFIYLPKKFTSILAIITIWSTTSNISQFFNFLF